MSGGKGGSTSSSVEIPEYIEKAAQRNLNKAERISQIGYTPYYGPDVAAFTPMQQASFQNTADVASAFGMGTPTAQQDVMGGMGVPTQYANGLSGYSSAPIYQQSLDELARQRPAQKSYIDSFFIDPYSGGYGSNAPMPINYNDYMTNAEAQRQAAAAQLQEAEAQRLADSRREARGDANYQRLLDLMGQQVSGSSLTQQEMTKYANTIAPSGLYDPQTQVLNEAQRKYIQSPEGIAARLAQEDIAMGAVGSNQMGFYDNLKLLQNQEPSFQDPSGGMAYYNTFPDADGNPTRSGYDSTGGSYGGSLVTGNLSGNLTGLPEVGLLGLAGGVADNVYSGLNFEGAVDKQSDIFAESAAAGGFDPSTIDYDFNANNSTLAPVVAPALEYNGDIVMDTIRQEQQTSLPYLTPFEAETSQGKTALKKQLARDTIIADALAAAAPVVAPVVKADPAPVVAPAPAPKKKKSTSTALKKEMSKQQKNISAVKSGTYKKSMGGF